MDCEKDYKREEIKREKGLRNKEKIRGWKKYVIKVRLVSLPADKGGLKIKILV